MLRGRATRCRSSYNTFFSSCLFTSRLAGIRAGVHRAVSTRVDHAPVIHRGTSSKRKPVHRLFLAGVNPFLPSHLQSSISPVFTEVPLDEWISSISGRNAGISKRGSMQEGGIRKEDIEVTNLASGLGHAMIVFRDRRTDEEKIFAIGRNESGQLGVGYNSQVSSRNPTLSYICKQYV